jgi:hypothetical protein
LSFVFSVHYLGFVPRCSLEEDDAGEFRLSKIERLVEECRFGINDLSAVALDAGTGLPRFNMPLELGLFLGCKRFGSPNQSKKRILVLDREQYRYRAFISDISGQDIRVHGGDPERAIQEVRDWLRLASNLHYRAGRRLSIVVIRVNRRSSVANILCRSWPSNPTDAPSSASSSLNTLPSIHAAR